MEIYLLLSLELSVLKGCLLYEGLPLIHRFYAYALRDALLFLASSLNSACLGISLKTCM